MFLKIYFFIYLKAGGMEREIFHLLARFSNGSNGQHRARLKQGARALAEGGRGPRIEVIFCYLPRHITREVDWKQGGQDSNVAA